MPPFTRAFPEHRAVELTPVKARPRELPVTQIEMWMRDPYAVYARYILRLRALDELDAEPGAAELGTTVHDALAKFVKQYPRDLPADPEAALIDIAQECFAPLLSRPGAWAFWWPRFQRIARWFVEEEALRRADVAEGFAETKGKLVIPSGRKRNADESPANFMTSLGRISPPSNCFSRARPRSLIKSSERISGSTKA